MDRVVNVEAVARPVDGVAEPPVGGDGHDLTLVLGDRDRLIGIEPRQGAVGAVGSSVHSMVVVTTSVLRIEAMDGASVVVAGLLMILGVWRRLGSLDQVPMPVRVTVTGPWPASLLKM